MASKELQIKNSVIYLFAVGIGNLLPFFALPIFTRILATDDFGVLALVSIYAILVNGIANVGMTEAYKRNYFQYQDDSLKSSQLLFSTILFVVVTSFLFAALTFFFKEHLAVFFTGSPMYGNVLFFAFCAHAFNGCNYYYLNYFRNAERAWDYSVYTTITSGLNVCLALYFVAVMHLGVMGLILGQLGAGALVFFYLSFKFLKMLTPSLSKTLLVEALKVGYPLIPRALFGVVGKQFDKYMIGLVVSVGGVGIYNIGQRIATLGFTYMTAIHNVYQPQVFKKMFAQGEDGGWAVGRYLTPYAYASILAPLLISLFAEEIIVFMTPESFHGAIEITMLLSMYYGFLFFCMHPQLLYVKKTYILSFLSIFSILLNILLNIPFILKWGVVGAASATLLAGLIYGVFYFVISQRYYRIEWEYGKLAIIYLLFFVTTFTLLFLLSIQSEYIVRLLVKGGALIGYVLWGMKIGVLTKQNFMIVKSMFPFSQQSEKAM